MFLRLQSNIKMTLKKNCKHNIGIWGSQKCQTCWSFVQGKYFVNCDVIRILLLSGLCGLATTNQKNCWLCGFSENMCTTNCNFFKTNLSAQRWTFKKILYWRPRIENFWRFGHFKRCVCYGPIRLHPTYKSEIGPNNRGL